jgi:SAM-dependent methyltransferase
MDRQQRILGGIDLARSVGLEIGPLATPIVSRALCEVVYVDHADAEGLRRKYAEDVNVDVSKIVDVDAVWGVNTLQEAIGLQTKVDFVVASHVIEHVPNVIGWLREVKEVLRQDGHLRLAVPDRRFTFDFCRSESRLSDMVYADLVNARVPLPHLIIDHVLEVVTLDVSAAWNSEVETGVLEKIHTHKQAIELASDTIRSGAYHDVHCWVFTPISFATLFWRASQIGLIPFECASITGPYPGEFEFYVALTACDNPTAATESWRCAYEALALDTDPTSEWRNPSSPSSA